MKFIMFITFNRKDVMKTDGTFTEMAAVKQSLEDPAGYFKSWCQSNMLDYMVEPNYNYIAQAKCSIVVFDELLGKIVETMEPLFFECPAPKPKRVINAPVKV